MAEKPEAICLQEVRQNSLENINSKQSYDGDLNDHDLAELISDVESQNSKLQMGSDNGSNTVDVNGFGDAIDNNNEDDGNMH